MVSRNLVLRTCPDSRKPHKYAIRAGDIFLPLSAGPVFSRIFNNEINSKIKFDGGDLFSNAGLLLIKEFAVKIGLVKRKR